MSTSTFQPFPRPVPEYVDWLVGAFIALIGLAFAGAGGVVTAVVDRDLLAEGVASGRITVGVTERALTDVELVQFSSTVVTWTGIGLLVTGLALVALGIGFVILRRRVHRADETQPPRYPRSSAVYGAVVTTLLSVLPFSPVFGGGLAAYLDAGASGRPGAVGALSGVLAVTPLLVLFGFVAVGVAAGLAGLGEGGLAVVSIAGMGIVLLFTAGYSAGLGALGGFLGGRIADNG